MNATFLKRRKNLSQAIGEGVIILKNAPEKVRSNDTLYRYRHDSNFFYLTGFSEPESIAIIVGGDHHKSVLFCRDKIEEKEIWDGVRMGPEMAKDKFLFDETYSVLEFENLLPKFIKNKRVFYDLGYSKTWDETIFNAIRSLNSSSRRQNIIPPSINDIKPIIHEMRLIKDENELNIMRKAARISSSAHTRLMQTVQSGMWEFQLEAQLLYDFHMNGSVGPAYTSVVASGKNACTLHYINNDIQLKKGDLVLVDAGCEFLGYASDITRTFPVGNKFSTPQRDIYQLVLDAQLKAIKAVKPGGLYSDPHNVAIEVLSKGFVDLGLLKGPWDKVIEKQEYLQFYMHGTGHWLGMDVHDVGNYKSGEKWKKFKKGMVLTIEPGCYIRPNSKVPKCFWNLGVRIEDNVVIQEKKIEVITKKTPKKIDEIEELRKLANDI